MSDPNIWDDPELQQNSYLAFENVGDVASGTVLAVKTHRWDDGNVVPELLLRCDDGEERTMTASQTKLKIALVDKRPGVGDHVRITFTHVEPRPMGKTLKHFDVVVTKAGQPAWSQPAAAPAAPPIAPPPVAPVTHAAPAAAPPVAASPAPGGIDPVAAAAALAALTPEQRAALGI